MKIRVLLSLMNLVVVSSFWSQASYEVLESDGDETLALSSPVVQKMVYQKGKPNMIKIFRLEGVDYNDPDCFGCCLDMTEEEQQPLLYATILSPSDTAECTFFEEGAYEVVSFGLSGETIGESVTIMLNENFITNGIKEGFYFRHNISVTCKRPLRIARDKEEFVCFN